MKIAQMYRRIVELDVFGYKTYVAGCVAGACWLVFHAQLLDSLVVGYIVATVLYKITSKISFGLGFIMLVLVPIMNHLGKVSLSNNYAIYAFYFLGIGALSSIIELRKDLKKVT